MDEVNKIKHLAVIMDGNGRWAKERFLPKVEGHRRGAEAALGLVKSSVERGIEYLTLYAFSSENWLRPVEEVSDILGLLSLYLNKEIASLNENNIRLKVIGNLSKLDPKIVKSIDDAVELTKSNNAMTLCIAFGYGAREELLYSIKNIISTGVKAEDITQQMVMDNMYDPEMPDVDLMIRTSGEQRVSNFLLWQIAYAELYFATKYWPDFDKEDLDLAIEDFKKRKRNFGYAREQKVR
jgi:undecaprenyl diphosphate synthase